MLFFSYTLPPASGKESQKCPVGKSVGRPIAKFSNSFNTEIVRKDDIKSLEN